ncbi:hypothetical protein B0H17DRAFT_1149681 [Mycena rosella]|uniref:Uncharacterized protein n=1 Tax=Mycena rosella TaxID=1033263 RepID=A0AAD7C0H2_MYCRO|nr:hypothetical protein B0H17DRAFT_1149681 [Mycena rosella]
MAAHYVNTVAAPASKHGTLLVAGVEITSPPEIEPINVNDKMQASFHVQKNGSIRVSLFRWGSGTRHHREEVVAHISLGRTLSARLGRISGRLWIPDLWEYDGNLEWEGGGTGQSKGGAGEDVEHAAEGITGQKVSQSRDNNPSMVEELGCVQGEIDRGINLV